jgi:serine/threonine protein kinase
VHIGPYEIICELGQGGMGVVYRALQPSLNRVIALKVLPVQLESDPTSVARFRQEAETAARLRHPNIVTVHEAAVDSPPYYIAMEFLEGSTLADIITSRGRLELSEAIDLFKQICSALDHAHNKGIVHRDIKPSNIIVSDQSRAVLTDFGIARASDRTRLTTKGASFGTTDYMSPEQAKGTEVDHRSDLYSAAVVLYEMLAGRTPFFNDTPWVTIRQIIDEPPPPIRTFNPSVPREIETIVQRGMAKQPEKRHQSGALFSHTLSNAYKSIEAHSAAGKIRKPPDGEMHQARRYLWNPIYNIVLVISLLIIGIVLVIPGILKEAGDDSENGATASVSKLDPTVSPDSSKNQQKWDWQYQDQIKTATNQLNMGKYQTALTTLGNIPDSYREYAKVLELRAGAYYCIKNYSAAFNNAQKAVDLNQDASDSWATLALSAEKSGLPEEAKKAAKRVYSCTNPTLDAKRIANDILSGS